MESIDTRRRRWWHAAAALLVALALGGSVLLAGQRAAAAACTSTVVVILAHPDDALAFMHDNVRAPDDTPQTYATAVTETFGSMTGYRMFIHGSTNLTLTFFRQPPSTYPSNVPGFLYNHRNDPNLIGALSAFLGRYRPQKVYTLDTAGTLLVEGQQNCTVQDGGMIGSNECDHYDHVGSAILARQAVTASGIATTVHEFRGYRSALSATACLGPAGVATADGTRIVTLASCTGAPGFTLTSSGQLQVAGKCVESGSGTTSADVVIRSCTGAAYQRWSRDATSGVFTQLHSGLKLDLFNSGTAAGNKVITFPGTGNNNQKWVLL